MKLLITSISLIIGAVNNKLDLKVSSSSEETEADSRLAEVGSDSSSEEAEIDSYIAKVADATAEEKMVTISAEHYRQLLLQSDELKKIKARLERERASIHYSTEDTGDMAEEGSASCSNQKESTTDNDQKESTTDNDQKESTTDNDQKESTTDNDQKKSISNNNQEEPTSCSNRREFISYSNQEELTTDNDQKESTTDNDDYQEPEEYADYQEDSGVSRQEIENAFIQCITDYSEGREIKNSKLFWGMVDLAISKNLQEIFQRRLLYNLLDSLRYQKKMLGKVVGHYRKDTTSIASRSQYVRLMIFELRDIHYRTKKMGHPKKGLLSI